MDPERAEDQFPRPADAGEGGGWGGWGGVGDEPAPAESPEDRGFFVRLFVGFLVSAALAWVCYGVLPRWGVDLPWWVPLLGFAVIVVALLAQRAAEGEEGEGE